MERYLFVIDYQNDFVDGALGFPGAEKLDGKIAEKVRAYGKDHVLFTRDTHFDNYLETREGRALPVPHCIRGTEGWEIVPQLREYAAGFAPVDKPTFGSTALAQMLSAINQGTPVEKITLVGLCTDICVISNALLLKAFLPETDIIVDASCCAGVTPESHKNALAAMKACQITVEHEI